MKITYTKHQIEWHPHGAKCRTQAKVTFDNGETATLNANMTGVNKTAAKANAKHAITTQAEDRNLRKSQ